MNRFEPFDEPNEDEVIQRVIEGRASEQDWNTVEALSVTGFHARIVETMRAMQELSTAVDRAGDVAERVELPRTRTAPGHRSLVAQRLVELTPWIGWAAALVLTCILWTPSQDRMSGGGLMNSSFSQGSMLVVPEHAGNDDGSPLDRVLRSFSPAARFGDPVAPGERCTAGPRNPPRLLAATPPDLEALRSRR